MRPAMALVISTLIVVGCLSEADRTFFDDSTAEGGAETSTGEADVPPLGDGGDGAANADGGDSQADAGPTHNVGGIVIGLAGSGLTLRLNAGTAVPVTANGGQPVPFFFSNQGIAEGQPWAVTVATQPNSPTQTCRVGGGAGTIGKADITSVVVNCFANQFTLGGTITGLEGDITLQKDVDGGDGGSTESLTLTTNDPFAFSKAVETGDTYAVSIAGHSALPEQLCNITGATGTVSTMDITSVNVACIPKYALQQSFDGVTAPALPTGAGWSTSILTSTGNPMPFFTTSSASLRDTPPNGAIVQEHSNISDIVLTSPTFTVRTNTAKLSFHHSYDLEAATMGPTAWDGAVVEISTNGGTVWTDIITAGGTWVPAYPDVGYTGYSYAAGVERRTPTPNTVYLNPLIGRHAFTGVSGWVLTTVTLPLAANASARIRFRLGTDKQIAVANGGWRIDTILVTN